MTPPRFAVFIPRPELRGGGDKHALSIAEILLERGDVTVVTEHLDTVAKLQEIGRFHNLDLTGCHLLCLPRGRSLASRAAYRLQAPVELIRRFQNREDYRDLRRKGFDVFVNVAAGSTLINPSPVGIFVCMFPNPPPDTLPDSSVSRREAWADAVSPLIGGSNPNVSLTYDIVLPNSTFTKEWLQRWWGAPQAEVLFPPCEPMARTGVTRRKLIVNVGRFFSGETGSHHKRQDVLLRTFATMGHLHDEGWELALVGPVHEGPGPERFVADLKQQARGLPVQIMTGVDHGALVRLMNEASIYWHATGFGTEINREPSRQEHFGMSTVEAMSAGAVPIVYAGAGARDTVEDGVTGYTWQTVDELRRLTTEVAGDEALRERLAEAAKQSSERFGRAAFRARLLQILDALSLSPAD